MNVKSIAIVLGVLLVAAIASMVYLYSSNPVKGYKEVYDLGNFKLFAKDTADAVLQKAVFHDGGERIKYDKGVTMIKEYQKEIVTREDSMKMTRYVDFYFDNVFSYMTYLIGKYPRELTTKDTLGFRVYVGKNLEPTSNGRGGLDTFRTMLFAPVKKEKHYKFVFNKDFEFFNQGSICPINCPDDDGSGFQ